MAYLKHRILDIPSEADPFSLESLIAWLEKQPADKEYDYYDCDGACLYGQYGAAIRLARPMDAWDRVCDSDCLNNRNHAGDIAARTPWTFGAALTRAKRALQESRL